MNSAYGVLAMSKRESRIWLHMVVYAFTVTITTYVVIDLDHPSFGLIRLTSAERAMVELQESMR